MGKNEITLTETDKFVLSSLIARKELNKYEICSTAEHAYSGIYAAVKKLLTSDLIQISRKDPGRRNRRMEVEYYRIKISGILEFLKSSSKELFYYAFSNSSPSYSLIDGSDKKWRLILFCLLKYHPDIFPAEFQDLSEEFALALSADYCFIHAYSGEDPTRWSLLDELSDELTKLGLPLGVRGITVARKYLFQTLLELIQNKTNKKAPLLSGALGEFLLLTANKEYIARLCTLMSDRDLAIIYDIVEELASTRKQNYEAAIRGLQELLVYLGNVKS